MFDDDDDCWVQGSCDGLGPPSSGVRLRPTVAWPLVEFTMNKEIYFQTFEHFLWSVYKLGKFIISSI